MSTARDGESFLSRWSRRKIEGDSADEATPDATVAVPADGVPDTGASAEARDAPDDETSARADGAEVEPDTRFDDVDFDALDYNSDYTRFMGADVPEDIRNQALQKLWTSDPILANVDGLTDYSDDFTDAALAVPLGMLKTAHKVGRGFLTDEDVAKWESLGKTPEAAAADGGPVAATDVAPGARIMFESPVQDEVRDLFAQSDQYTHNLYPAESNHMLTPEALVAAGAVFVVARAYPDTEAHAASRAAVPADVAGRAPAVGCGALVVRGDGTGELKRMWVVPEARGQRIGRQVLDALVDEARSRNLTHVLLETGTQQPEAIGLYERAGFVRRGPFGGYADDPNSIFMELALAPDEAEIQDDFNDG
jgi:putative acetyltransferase